MKPPLSGSRILVVEDEYLLAQDLVRALRLEGAEIIGPAATVSAGLALLSENAVTDGAVIDVNLRGQDVYPVADALLNLGIPFIFATGYDPGNIPSRYDPIPRCEKPVSAARIAELIFPPNLTREMDNLRS